MAERSSQIRLGEKLSPEDLRRLLSVVDGAGERWAVVGCVTTFVLHNPTHGMVVAVDGSVLTTLGQYQAELEPTDGS